MQLLFNSSTVDGIVSAYDGHFRPQALKCFDHILESGRMDAEKSKVTEKTKKEEARRVRQRRKHGEYHSQEESNHNGCCVSR